MNQMPEIVRFGHAARPLFFLEDEIVFLTHGTFGATPRAVLAAADAWRRRMEAEPVRFMSRELPGALREAAARLGRFVGARGEDLVFLDNATTAINAILRSLDLAPGDVLLTTNHVYGAVGNTLRYVAARTGAEVVEVDVPIPLNDADGVLDAITTQWPVRTRLLVIDHVTSPSALVLPVERVVALAHARGSRVLIDGAHAPGMVSLDIESLGADYYVANCHKWLFAPKGCAFLWASPAMQFALHPAVISHGLGKGYLAEFDWTGTRDHSAWLAVGAALDFVERIGAERITAHNHALACEAAALLSRAWGTPVAGPDPMLGAMASVRAPKAVQPASPATIVDAQRLHDRLYEKHRIEVPVIPFDGRLWIRLSAQIYNQREDYIALASALEPGTN